MADEFNMTVLVPVEINDKYNFLRQERNELIPKYEAISESLIGKRVNVFNYGIVKRELKKSKKNINDFLKKSREWVAESQKSLLSLKYEYDDTPQKNFVYLRFEMIWGRWIDEMENLHRAVWVSYNDLNNRIDLYKNFRIAYIGLLLAIMSVIMYFFPFGD